MPGDVFQNTRRFSQELRALCHFNNTQLCNTPLQNINWWTVLLIPSDLLILCLLFNAVC